MSRSATQPANPAPAITSTNRPPDIRGLSLRPYSYFRPFPNLPEKWQSPQAQAKLLNEYLTHDGHFATFAAQRDLSVDQLYDWLHSEEIVDQRKRLSDMAQERADLLARLARPAAIEALLNLLTNGCMSSNHCRLTASALLRAAAAADRREEKQSRAARTPSATEPAAPDLPAPNLPAPRPAPPSIPVPPVSGSSAGRCRKPLAIAPRADATKPAPAHRPLMPTRHPPALSPPRALTRIAGTPIPPRSRRKRPHP